MNKYPSFTPSEVTLSCVLHSSGMGGGAPVAHSIKLCLFPHPLLANNFLTASLHSSASTSCYHLPQIYVLTNSSLRICFWGTKIRTETLFHASSDPWVSSSLPLFIFDWYRLFKCLFFLLLHFLIRKAKSFLGTPPNRLLPLFHWPELSSLAIPSYVGV